MSNLPKNPNFCFKIYEKFSENGLKDLAILSNMKLVLAPLSCGNAFGGLKIPKFHEPENWGISLLDYVLCETKATVFHAMLMTLIDIFPKPYSVKLSLLSIAPRYRLSNHRFIDQVRVYVVIFPILWWNPQYCRTCH
jgi:hypothetical protein